MLYRFVRAVMSFALGMFYRTQVTRSTDDLEGPLMFVGNHPNSIIDPALVFVITQRKVTFLAREPLFRVPVFGFILRGLGALPVYRKQDHPGLMEKNEGTLDAAAQALAARRPSPSSPRASRTRTRSCRRSRPARRASRTGRRRPARRCASFPSG